ncbi:MAG: hypothetical protein M3R49_09805 [Chloroflexota bacterium]|nr:hypothetical protein [Chloroflexota bacterium]
MSPTIDLMAGASPSAIGRLFARGPWVGFALGAEGYALAFDDLEGGVRLAAAPSRAGLRDDLLAIAICYFDEAFGEAPADLEATHAEIGDLLRWLAESERDPACAPLLREAADAVDDGLPADVVIARLAAAGGHGADAGPPAEPISRLTERYRSPAP